MDMSIKRTARAFLLVVAACMLCVFLAACGGDENAPKTPAEQNRAYMASVNSIGAEASDALNSFSDAVAAGDVAAMRQCASDAAKKLEKFEQLSAPEALSQVHEEYKAGASDISAALGEYIEAYASLQNQPENAKDASAFEEKVAAVQARYDTGIKHLSDADAMVASLASGETDGSTEGASAQQ